MIDRTYRDDPYEYMSQEPCDYCPYQHTNICADCYYLWNKVGGEVNRHRK